METLHSIIGMILAGLAIYISICVVWYIILAVANWKIFSKAGEEGWKSLIPFLNSYVIFKIAWQAKMFWIFFGSVIAGSICTTIAGEDGGVLSIIGMILSLVGCVMAVIVTHKLSKSYGHGIGFTLGLLFLSPIFTMILGFGKSQYQGPA